MDIDELDSEILRCLYLASATADLDAARELRARATRLNIVAKGIKLDEPLILGFLPPTAHRSDARRDFAKALTGL